jgi:integrase
MSGVRLAKNGVYWQAIWNDLQGNRKVKSLGRISEAEARRQCRQLEALHIAKPGSANAGKAPTLGAWRDQYFTLRDGELKEGTEGLHRQTFRRLCDHFGEGIRLDKITKLAAAGFKTWLASQPDHRSKATPPKMLSSQSVARHIRDCKVIFGTAQAIDLIPINPFEHVKAGSAGVGKTWQEITRAELARLVDVSPPEWAAAWSLARLAGLRRGEILRLSVGDIDWVRNQLHILPEANHAGERIEGTKQRERWVPISPELATVLLRRLEQLPAGEHLLCRIPTQNIHRDAVRFVKLAGLPAYSKPFHTLKKCLASEWLAEGLNPTDVAQWLGDSVDVLMRHYARSLQRSAGQVTGRVDVLADLRRQLAEQSAELEKLRRQAKPG